MNVADRILNLIFPPKCFGCGELLSYYEDSALCPRCRALFEKEKIALCPDCEKKHIKCKCRPDILRGYVNTALHLAEYTKEESITTNLILSIKERNDKYLYGFLSDELCKLLEGNVKNLNEYFITFVPRSADKKRVYGIDQSEKLSRLISKKLGIPWIKAFKRKKSKEQKKLTGEERLENAMSSYELKKGALLDVCNRKIILVDDVITTASSVYACSSLLNLNGAAKIVCVTIGKTYKINNSKKATENC